MDYYIEIKDRLINNEITKKVKDYGKNGSDLQTYFDVGKLIVDAQGGEERAHYGDGLIKEYSKKLSKELGKGYSSMNLKYMRKFYLQFRKGQTMSVNLTWSHYVELLKFDDINKINYYISISTNQNLSVRELRERIKNNEYERLSNETKNKLITKEKTQVTDFIKNPIVIKSNIIENEISEKLLKQIILENIDDFLSELGEDFCYRGNEYKIKIGDRYNYIDILLFNIKYNCYVVIELKVTELKSEYIGQISKYINYIDKNIKTINQNKTIGIIICKKDNKFVMQYCTDDTIFRTTYKMKIKN